MKAYIYNGFGEMLEYKGVFEVANSDTVKITRSTETDRAAVMLLVGDGAELVQQNDIIRIEAEDLIWWGTVNNPKWESEEPGIVEVAASVGLDGVYDEIRVEDSTTKLNIIEYVANAFAATFVDNPRPIEIRWAGSDQTGYIRVQDGLLPLNKVIRQLQKQSFREEVTIEDDKLIFTYDKLLVNWSVPLETVLNYSVEFAKNAYTRCLLYKKNDFVTPPFVAYLKQGGIVDENITGQIKPVVTKYVEVEEEEFTQFTANTELKNQSFNNSITVEIGQNYVYSFILQEKVFRSLGTQLQVYIPQYGFIFTYLREIIYQNGNLTLILGGSASRYIDKINEDIGGK